MFHIMLIILLSLNFASKNMFSSIELNKKINEIQNISAYPDENRKNSFFITKHQSKYNLYNECLEKTGLDVSNKASLKSIELGSQSEKPIFYIETKDGIQYIKKSENSNIKLDNNSYSDKPYLHYSNDVND